MPRTRIAALEFALHWQSPLGQHTERVYFERLSFWRDFFPGALAERLGGLTVGAASESFPAVTGLGLNAEELGQNPRLGVRSVHDLNEQPRLPYPDAYFDAMVCTASVEYLIRPVEVFREVRRVLKPGAPFVLTFSERWFPPKAIAVWAMLHPFERLGLVLDYFRQSGGFTGLGTETARGWPRPEDDKYAGQLPDADPLYAAWGRAA